MALVTGASAGIGAAICRVLAERGMKVVGCARRIDKIEELAKAQPGIIPYKVKYNTEFPHPIMQRGFLEKFSGVPLPCLASS